jgi:hypothetical protein
MHSTCRRTSADVPHTTRGHDRQDLRLLLLDVGDGGVLGADAVALGDAG